MESNWHSNWLRTGRLPDGRECFEVHTGAEKIHVCCDPIVLERTRKGLSVPWPGEVAEDGFVTPWEELKL